MLNSERELCKMEYVFSISNNFYAIYFSLILLTQCNFILDEKFFYLFDDDFHERYNEWMNIVEASKLFTQSKYSFLFCSQTVQVCSV